MKKLLLVLGMIVPVLGMAAERILTDPRGNVISLLDTPCTSEAGALVNMTPAARKIAKASSIFWQGKLYDGCYVEFDEQVFLVDEQGGQGVLPSKIFLPKHGT